jgi:hypothetical protein
MTPAELAREFAEKHGFTIEPVGRRYKLYRDVDEHGEPNVFADVGGYPAALNAMKRYMAGVEQQNEDHAARLAREVPAYMTPLGIPADEFRTLTNDEIAEDVQACINAFQPISEPVLRHASLLKPWQVFQSGWPVASFNSPGEAYKFCAQRRNNPLTHNLKREVRYVP